MAEKNMQTIGIVTVLYNSEKVLKDYFESLSKQTYKNFILYVVDNKSPDNSLGELSQLRMEYSQIKCCVILNNVNGGVAQGNNMGIKKALEDGCDYILLSNNDVVLNDNTIETLLNGLVQHDIDMAVSKIYFFGDPLIWYVGGKFRYVLGSTIHLGYLKPDNKKWDNFRLTEYAPTCFILIKKDVFADIGLFDEKYFVYYDDTDWIYRCRKRKKKIGIIPSSKLWHKESSSTGGMTSDFYIKFNYRNQVYFCRKHFSFLHNLLVAVSNVLYFVLFKRKHFNKAQRYLLREAVKNGLKM